MQDMSDDSVLCRIREGYNLPSLSLVALKLVDLATSETASIEQITSLIETDPALTVRLLRLANSVFFCTAEPVATIEQAVMRIGSNHLRLMALSLSLRDTFPMGKVGSMDYERFWRSSLYQALIAKKLAQGLRTCPPEEAFVAGLVLEVGFLIFHDLFIKGKDIQTEFHFYPLQPLLGWEREHFGVDHRQVGEAALRFWRFPESIIAGQRVHSLDEPLGTIPPIAIVSEVAREFAALICEESHEWDPLFRKAESVYAIHHDVLSDILVSTLQEVDKIAESLKVAVDPGQDTVSLVKKANTSLGELSVRVLIWQRQLANRPLPLGKAGQTPESREMLQSIMHEIRNPLTLVGGFAKRLSCSMSRDAEGWEYVQIIIEESQRLENVLANLTSETTAN